MQLPITMKSTGEFINWVMNDIFTEEANLLSDMDLNKNDVKKQLSRQIVQWYKSLG